MRVGFVGCGSHATTSLYPALRPAGLELVATCTRHLDRAQKAANAFGAARAHDDVAGLIAADCPDYRGIAPGARIWSVRVLNGSGARP